MCQYSGPRTLRSDYRCSRLGIEFVQTKSHLIRWQDQIAAGVYNPNRRRSAFQQALGASERVINRCIPCVARFCAVCRFGRHEITRRHSDPPVCFFAVAFNSSVASKRHRGQARNLFRFNSRSGALSATKFEIVSMRCNADRRSDPAPSNANLKSEGLEGRLHSPFAP